MMRDYALLSLKTLKKRGIRSWLTMLGIFIGIAAVVSLISLGEGLQQAITGQFSTLGPDRLIVESASTGFGPPGANAIRKLSDDDKVLIEGVSGVESVISRLVRVVRVDYNKIAEFKFVASIPEEQSNVDEIYQAVNIEIADGRLLDADDRDKIVLGDDFISENDFDKPLRVGSHLTIQGEDFEVVGILKRAGSFQINSAILMPEEDMREILNLGDEHDLFVVRVIDKDRTEEIGESIAQKLRRDRRQDIGEEDFSVQTPVQALDSVNTILTVINLVVAGIAAISLIVGGIGITNTMYTSVLERTKEIGIMKAIGARNKDILLLFLIEAGLLGFVGGVVGVLVGAGISTGIEFIATTAIDTTLLKAVFPVYLIFGALGFAFAVGSISGLVPAWRASRLKPVDALRYE